MPKRPRPVKDDAFPVKTRVVSNHYRMSLRKSTDIYCFVLETEPAIPDDSIQVLRGLVKSIEKQLDSLIGLVGHKGKNIWGIKSMEKALVAKGNVG